MVSSTTENGDSLDEGEDFNLCGGNDRDAPGGEGVVYSAAGGRVSPGAEAKPANDQNETTEDRPRHGSKSFMFVRGLRTGSAYLFCAFASKKRATRITHPSYFQLLHCTTFWTRIFFCFFSSIRRGIYQGCTLPRFKAVTYR